MNPFFLKNHDKVSHRLLISTPTTGMVRMEWVNARFGQTIPTNWSHVDVVSFLNPHVPIGFQLTDAENMAAKAVVEGRFEWLLFLEHDNVLPPNAFVRLNQYMIKKSHPVVAGLYFTKSSPPEPMVYREAGKGFYADWKMGDKVACSGVPFGFTLIHGDIIRALWKESPEYLVGSDKTRRVFDTPSEAFLDPKSQDYLLTSGTSDLAFCKRLKDDKIFEKAGWPEFQKMEHPLLVDTNIYIKHIDNDGVMWPVDLPQAFLDGQITFKQALEAWK